MNDLSKFIILILGFSIGMSVGLENNSWFLFFLIFLGPLFVIKGIEKIINNIKLKSNNNSDLNKYKKKTPNSKKIILKNSNTINSNKIVKKKSKKPTKKKSKKPIKKKSKKFIPSKDFDPDEKDLKVFSISQLNYIIHPPKNNNNNNNKLNEENIIFRNSLPVNDSIDPNYNSKNKYYTNVFHYINRSEILMNFNENFNLIKLKNTHVNYVGINKIPFQSKFLVKFKNKIYNLEDYVLAYYNFKNFISLHSIINAGYSLDNIFTNNNIVDKSISKFIFNLPKKQLNFFKSHSIGMPDLFIYNKKNNSAYFVEVKSEIDKLSITQKYWFNEFVKLNSKIGYILHTVKNSYKDCNPSSQITIIKGIQYRSLTVEYLDSIKEGTNLILKLEPNNKFDPTAIQVFNKEIFIGYLSRNLLNKDKLIQSIKNNQYICYLISKNQHYTIKGYRLFVEINYI